METMLNIILLVVLGLLYVTLDAFAFGFNWWFIPKWMLVTNLSILMYTLAVYFIKK